MSDKTLWRKNYPRQNRIAMPTFIANRAGRIPTILIRREKMLPQYIFLYYAL